VLLLITILDKLTPLVLVSYNHIVASEGFVAEKFAFMITKFMLRQFTLELISEAKDFSAEVEALRA